MADRVTQYRWAIRPVPGEWLRAIGWRLAMAPAGKVIKASGRRSRTGKWLLAITDDRKWTLDHLTPTQRFLRKRLGRQVREYVLVERDS